MKILLILFCFLLFSDNYKCEELNLAKHASSAVLIEATTHKILYEKDKDSKRSPASMTKMMTLLLTMEALENKKVNLNDEVRVSKNSSSMGGTQIFLEEGSKVKLETLIKGIAIGSANDAAVSVAEYIGGTLENFVLMMNDKAKELGCKNTNFKNPHGLDEKDHYSSAYDMALIASELVKYPYILKVTSTYEDYINIKGENHWLVNTNKLVRFYSGIDGLKTGYTDDALYCLTATMQRNDMRLISVVMKEENKDYRNEDTISMMEYGFSMFGSKKIIDKNKYKKNIYISNSINRNVNYYLDKDVNIIVNKDKKDVKYTIEEELYNVKAPLKKNDKVGILKLKYDNKVYNYDLVIHKDVNKSNYFQTLLNILKDIICGVRGIF